MTVKLIKDTTVHLSPSVRAMLLLTATLILGACASQQVQQVSHPLPPLKHSGPDVQVGDIDLLAVTPAMDKFLEEHILTSTDKRTRKTLLLAAITKNGALEFKYDAALSLTAAEAFEQRAGNCIGFANMTIALARRAGLKAYYQQVSKQQDWSRSADAVLLIKHINVVISYDLNTSTVVDITGLNIGPNVRQWTVEDSYAKALYLNNIGVDAMLGSDLPTAYAYFHKAIDEQPELTDTWVNVGVAFGRNGQLNEAETAFQTALQIDQSEYAAMSNLYEVYIAQNELEAAAQLEKKVEKHRRGNPYYLLELSNEAVENQQFDEAISLLRRAIRKKDDDHLLHFALARTQYLSGEIKAAENSLFKARKVAPDNMLAVYDLPINELMVEIGR